MNRSGVALRLLSLCAIAGLAGAAPVFAAEPADLLIVNGRMPTAKAGTTALAISGNKIVAVGRDADVAAFRGAATKVIDAGGHTVLPGFNDNHVHISSGAESLAVPDVRTAPDLAALQQIVRAHAAAHPDQAWVEAGGWTMAQVPASGPTRQMLDAAVPDRPAVLWSLDRHTAWLNTKGLQAAKITRDTKNPPEGFIERDAAGEPTGWLKEFSAQALIHAAMPKQTEADQRRLLTIAMDEAHRNGVTAVNVAGGEVEEFERLDNMRKAGQLSLRVTYALSVRPGFKDEEFTRYQQVWKAHPDTPLLKTGVVKMFLDGVPQAQSAFLLEPFGPQAAVGEPVYDPVELKRLVTRFDAAGWQVMTHAMGDGAVRLALDAYEEAERVNPAPARGRRHRVEHVFLMAPSDGPRFAKLGVIAAYQPSDVFLPPDTVTLPPDPKRPPQDGARWNAVMAAGGRMSLGSDWPVFVMNPLARIYAIANSRRVDQRMDVVRLFNAYTRDSAYTTFDEADQGALEPGKFADIAILSRDLIGAPPRTANDLAVDTTIFDGRVVYQRVNQGAR